MTVVRGTHSGRLTTPQLGRLTTSNYSTAVVQDSLCCYVGSVLKYYKRTSKPEESSIAITPKSHCFETAV